MMGILSFLITLLFFLPSYGETIRLITYWNGVGIKQDTEILFTELKKLGHEVHSVYFRDQTPLPKVDINLYVEVFNEFFLPFAKENYFLPNPEHCFESSETLAKLDKILCKTKEAERIFKPLNPNAIFTSFTSKDKYDEKISKNYHTPLHLAGGSIQKGTKQVIKVWMNNPQFPTLKLLRHEGMESCPPATNIDFITTYLSDSCLQEIQNQCGIHLCPSETEGFGHYIMEAMSCGSIVITTDAPPMNEFIQDKRCLASYRSLEDWRLAKRYFVDPDNLDLKIANILALSEEEAKDIGMRNRKFYLENDQFFKNKLQEIFPKKLNLGIVKK